MHICKTCGQEVPDSYRIRAKLTPAQYNVLMLHAKGHGNKVIARLLNRSKKTIATHKERIGEKLKVKGDVQWMSLYREIWKEEDMRASA